MFARSRLALAALLTDMALYLVMLSLPFRALDLGATPLVLGMVQGLYSAPYSLVAMGAGRLSDRWPRRRLIRLGCGIAALAAFAVGRAPSLRAIFLITPFLGIGLGFFWPSMQAGFSELRRGADLHGAVGWFNVAWSTGKGLGFLVGGLLLGLVGSAGVTLCAAGCLLLAATLLPWMDRPGDHAETLEREQDLPPERVRRAFLRAAWIANGATFGLVATLNHQYPKLLPERGFDPRSFGLFLGLLFLSQTVVFLLLSRWHGWRYRLGPLLGVQAMAAVLVLGVPHLHSLALLLLCAPLLGLAVGLGYQSSIYYSLHAPRGRGALAGVHEGTLGIASALVPFVGGLAVRGGGGLYAPYAVAAGCLLASLLWGLGNRLHAARGGRP